MTDLILPALTLAVVGAFAGVLAGLLGVGGGIVLVPAFLYLFSTSGYGSDDLMQICLATSLATIIVTSARSVMAHNRKGAVDWQVLKDWAPGIMFGAAVGVMLVSSLRTHTLQIIFGVLVVVIATYMMIGKSSWRLAEDMPQGPVKYVMAGLTGFVSVLLGIGGGSIGVPIMTLHGRPIHRAVATAAGFGALIALPSALLFLFTPTENAPPGTIGAVNIPAFLIVIAMTLLTAPLGAALAHRLDAKMLKKVFAVFLMLVALNMLRKALF
ncbi:MAG TPA: sulfite exporter TauE/SafE family protein [Paracoccus sp. (in: a-proteobacteria)]|uniref:sulfite exporter TauE/SafE family protein n=1 Tax=uncultured Paracoccus sp. TaxID=189685 RepID=UPI00260657AF|nr:sulfite exporter TauE/SafE family protein [uncultured Paracoccus sp.]HMQ39994.1 sulfite exporter TauE/SafE family protein [Paracoccus sp. (in: a-proteobacteria)]HMR36929.1 sulfite exporter TauE/SafE family protein [Paracoccus sp. (in: a-proteobacteria)]